MMTMSNHDLAGFFAARSRSGITAEQALKDLEARGVATTARVSKASARAVCDSAAAKAGRKLSDITSHELADILDNV